MCLQKSLLEKLQVSIIHVESVLRINHTHYTLLCILVFLPELSLRRKGDTFRILHVKQIHLPNFCKKKIDVSCNVK